MIKSSHALNSKFIYNSINVLQMGSGSVRRQPVHRHISSPTGQFTDNRFTDNQFTDTQFTDIQFTDKIVHQHMNF